MTSLALSFCKNSISRLLRTLIVASRDTQGGPTLWGTGGSAHAHKNATKVMGCIYVQLGSLNDSPSMVSGVSPEAEYLKYGRVLVIACGTPY